MGKALDIAGKRFGRLVAIRNTGEKNGNGSYIWEFKCDCGNTHITGIGNIVYRGEGSCGCLTRELAADRLTTHGLSKGKEHKSWCKINERCFNVDCVSYPAYGGSGITSEFKDSFEEFYKEVGPYPSDGKRYTVDRIDNTRGYVKGNIRWATFAQQARNKGLMKNNTSGKNGVSWEDKVHPNGVTSTTYALAQWHDLDGKIRKKCFSVKKYGLLEAFAMACAYRDAKIRELNEQGAEYSSTHGK